MEPCVVSAVQTAHPASRVMSLVASVAASQTLSAGPVHIVVPATMGSLTADNAVARVDSVMLALVSASVLRE